LVSLSYLGEISVLGH